MALLALKISFRKTNSTSSRVPSPMWRDLTSKQSTAGLPTSSRPGPAPAHTEQAVNVTARIAPPGKRLLPTFRVSSPEQSGKRVVRDIVDLVGVRRASGNDATKARAPGQASGQAPGQGSGVAPLAREPALIPLTAVDVGDWRALSQRAIESNGYYLPDWQLAVNATAPGRMDASALSTWKGARLIGLMPVVPLSRAMQIP